MRAQPRHHLRGSRRSSIFAAPDPAADQVRPEDRSNRASAHRAQGAPAEGPGRTAGVPERTFTVRGASLALLGVSRRVVIAAAVGLMLCSVVPAAFGWTTTVVVSGSMAPGIQAGDIVAAAPVSKADARRLVPGTVVLVDDPAAPGTLLLHRMVQYTGAGEMITKGDANVGRDTTPVPLDNLRGVARLRVPSIGLPALWAKHGDYLPLAALVLLTAIVLLWRPRTAR